MMCHTQISRKTRELRGVEPMQLQLRTRVNELSAEQSTIEGKIAALEERRQSTIETGRELTTELKSLQAQSSQLAASSSSGMP